MRLLKYHNCLFSLSPFTFIRCIASSILSLIGSVRYTFSLSMYSLMSSFTAFLPATSNLAPVSLFMKEFYTSASKKLRATWVIKQMIN